MSQRGVSGSQKVHASKNEVNVAWIKYGPRQAISLGIVKKVYPTQAERA